MGHLVLLLEITQYSKEETTMKIDTYTKFILTIIALCLVWICIKDTNLATPIQAQAVQPPTHVIIDGYTIVENGHPQFRPVWGPQSLGIPIETLDKTGKPTPLLININGLSETNPLPIKINGVAAPGGNLPVNISGLSENNPLPVKIDAIKRGYSGKQNPQGEKELLPWEEIPIKK